MTEKHFILATAGHVDHGKSALVKALTGTDPDRLPEEKARGITIDLGFAELNLTSPNNEKFHVGIIDVPGHEDFVRNMIAGVGSIDLALMIVAVDDGWMPQTEEHLQILSYLGVKHMVVALTKIDLGNADAVKTEIQQNLTSSAFAEARIVPTSVETGEGLEELKLALTSEFDRMTPSRDIGKPRLFVDRAFTLRGIGTVVTGTLTGGHFRSEEKVIVQPTNLEARIRSIQSHGREVEAAQAGTRTALSLPDLSVGTGPSAVKRGDVITSSDSDSSSTTIGVALERSARLARNNPAARPMKSRSSVYVYFGTTRIAAKVELLVRKEIQPGGRTIAAVRLQSPIFAFLGDRFVVRDPSERQTIAGGVILDPDEAQHCEVLRAREVAFEDVDLCLRSEISRAGLLQRRALLAKSHFSSEEVADAVSRLIESGDIVLRGEIVANVDTWRRLRQRASELIDSAHRKHPENRGLDISKLRANLGELDDQHFEALMNDLCASDFTREESAISRASHRPTLPSAIQPAAERIRLGLAAKPFDPPGRRELAPDSNGRQALRFLIEQREAIGLGGDVVVLREAVEQMQNKIVAFISANGSATASQLRQVIGTSRRIIIPFLEYLDRAGVTKRTGDFRQLRETKSATVAQP